MKLELKHLAPYLPYGLKMYDVKNPEYTPELVGIINEDVIRLTLPRFPYGQKFSMIEFKPILRPLSDLSKNCNEVDSYASYLWFAVIGTDEDSFNKDDFFEYCELGMINFLPIMVYNKLFEWHFVIDEPEGSYIKAEELETNPYEV